MCILSIICIANEIKAYFFISFRKYRYTAYRNLVLWAWGRVGKHNRIPLPSCVLSAIRERYPSADGQYTGHLPAPAPATPED